MSTAMSDERPALGMNDILALLTYGELIPQTSMPWSSNATILCIVAHEGNQALAIYKPQRGERPLWDFTRGTLCQREAAAFVLSQELKWHLVPPTVLRDWPVWAWLGATLYRKRRRSSSFYDAKRRRLRRISAPPGDF
jgi:uncharacterized repeat protein (TIGR03843 family)